MVYSDASWKVDNTYAGFFVLFCNGAIDWAAKLLKVQMSSTEAEIAAGSIAGKRVIYIRGFIGCIIALPKQDPGVSYHRQQCAPRPHREHRRLQEVGALPSMATLPPLPRHPRLLVHPPRAHLPRCTPTR